MKDTSLYIHIPYCASKCIYCDFFSGGAKIADWKRFADALINELEIRKRELLSFPDTLYIGGGTPSLMPLHEFMGMVDRINNIINPKGLWREFTVEVNPDDVSEDMCVIFRNCGVNRVSMGMQSLNDQELQRIRRRHNSEDAMRAYHCLRKYFSNVSVDLMFGIPGQSLCSWENTVDQVLKLQPAHISAYSLMLEAGTPLSKLYELGKVSLPGDDECGAMWKMLSEKLGGAGYEQYEISNYCMPGKRSVHNSRYWSGNPYLGLGPSAHSYDGQNIRRGNPADLIGYLERFAPVNEDVKQIDASQNIRNFFNEEVLTKEERIEEYILTRTRVKEGIDLDLFAGEFGERELQRLLRNAQPLIVSGDLMRQDGHLSITTKGIMISNRIMVELSM